MVKLKDDERDSGLGSGLFFCICMSGDTDGSMIYWLASHVPFSGMCEKGGNIVKGDQKIEKNNSFYTHSFTYSFHITA